MKDLPFGKIKHDSLKKLESELWKWFSLYIRQRDCKDGYFKCPSCGLVKEYRSADAGHFISRQFKSIKYDERNVYAQCKRCNGLGYADMNIFRNFIIGKHGQVAIENLELKRDYEKAHPFKFQRFEFLEMIEKYKKLVK